MAEQEEGVWVPDDLSGAETEIQIFREKEQNFWAYATNARGALSHSEIYREELGTKLPLLEPKMDVLGLEKTFWEWVAKTQILVAGKLVVHVLCRQSIQGHGHLQYLGRQNTNQQLGKGSENSEHGCVLPATWRTRGELKPKPARREVKMEGTQLC